MANTSTKNKISNCISKGELRHLVAETIQKVLADPDFYLELREDVKERLEEKPKKLIPFEKIKKKYQ